VASPRPARRHHPGLHRTWRRVRLRLDDQEHGDRRLALAEFAAEVAKNYPVNIALHTDHCPKDKLDGFVRPLLAISAERVKAGGLPLFQSHMWDGSAVPLAENLQIAQELLAAAKAANIILEVEIGVVGGEEDGVANEINEQALHPPRTPWPPSRRSASARTAATWPR
jgi:fructose/tagatose bisphosphate aldolase